MKKEIPLFKVFMAETAATEVAKVLNSGYIGQGPKVDEFERELRDYFNLDYVLTTNSATSAEHLAIHMLKSKREGWPGLEPGDEVLSTALTCTASNWPSLANGLKIKWVDIDQTTLNMDLDDLERKITSKTKVIMLVHWGGYPND
jgi:dTDP-4-amino-4,6-dideoxygalactose transaminase